MLGEAREKRVMAFAIRGVVKERRPREAAVRALQEVIRGDSTDLVVIGFDAGQVRRVLDSRERDARRAGRLDVSEQFRLMGQDREDTVALPAARQRAGEHHVRHEMPVALARVPGDAANAPCGRE